MKRLSDSTALLAGALLTAPLAGRPRPSSRTPRPQRHASSRLGHCSRRHDAAAPSRPCVRVGISRVEDPVAATLVRAVVVDGRTVLPSGSVASGYVADATRPGKVKGRGRVAVRFTRITPAGDDDRYAMRTRSWVAVAPATKKKDALTIGLPAAGGAAIGALIDGKKGAGIGALAGGGAGTAVVLTTRGKDVRVNRGATLAVRLSEPLTVRVD